jgi:hypothetical protein
MKVSELRKVIKEEISSMIGEATSISTWPDDEIIGIFSQLKDKSSNIYKRFEEEMKKRNLDVAYNQSITDLEDFYGGKRPDNMNEMDEIPSSTSNLEKFAIALKKSIDSNDRFTIRPIPPTRIDGKMYYGIEKDDPERFNQFKYGSYAVEEPWGIIANMLGLDFEGEGYGKDTYDTIDKLMVSLRAKKLIDLEW